jgi:hypothetical protein
MRIFVLVPFAVLTGAAASAPAGAQLSPQALKQDFAAECRRITSQDIPALERRYGMTIDRGTAQVPRAVWARMDRIARLGLHWPLAFSASCALGHRGTFRVRVLDEHKRELAFQTISTRLECHGDHATIRPEDIEYLC